MPIPNGNNNRVSQNAYVMRVNILHETIVKHNFKNELFHLKKKKKKKLATIMPIPNGNNNSFSKKKKKKKTYVVGAFEQHLLLVLLRAEGHKAIALVALHGGQGQEHVDHWAKLAEIAL